MCNITNVHVRKLSCFFLSPTKILRDVPKARREVDLHWRVAAHENIVNLIDIYENVYMGQRSLLVVMEWYQYVLTCVLQHGICRRPIKDQRVVTS